MLNRLALRLATVRALRGKTLAGGNVRDSEQAAIDDLAVEHPTPVIVVYTDDGHWNVTGRNLFATTGDTRVGVGRQRLVIELVITQRMYVPATDPETGQPMFDEAGQPLVHDQAVPLITDASIEATLDILERQIKAALMSGDTEAAPWAEIWKQLVVDVADCESQRGASARDGVRFAGRQITLSVQLPHDPPLTETPGPLWTRFLALADTDPDLAPVLPMIRAALAGTPSDDPTRDLRTMFGLAAGEADALLAGAAPVRDEVPA